MTSRYTRYQKTLFAVFLAILVLLSIDPVNRADWFLEILPVLVAIPFIIWLGRIVNFSSVSYTLLAVYLILPIFSAHYTVINVPLGWLIAEWFGSLRNMFDRLSHFAFGFLCAYPIREIFVNVTGKKGGFWSYFFPLDITLSLSALYEIFEWYAPQFLSWNIQSSFIGAQGDFFDTQKDMAMALVGTISATIIIALINWYRGRRALRQRVM